MDLTHIFSVACVVGSWLAVIERLNAVFTVLVLNTYLQDATIFCDHSGIWDLMMIDKFTTDIKRTKTPFSFVT